jgi:trehalose 6-phosphate synthase
MPRQERWARYNRLRQRVETYDVTNWRDSFMQTFASSDADPVNVFANKLGAA